MECLLWTWQFSDIVQCFVVERCTVTGGMLLFLLCQWNKQERSGCQLHSCKLVFSRDCLVLVLRKQMPDHRVGDLRT